MKTKKFIVNGATIYALQDSDSVEFIMSINTCRCFHCVTLKAKIEDITEQDAKNIWSRYYHKIKKKSDAWRAELKKLPKSRKSRWKRKRTDIDDSEPVIREIQTKYNKNKKLKYEQKNYSCNK
jgi:hypothetical protein